MTLFAFAEPERPTTKQPIRQKLASLDPLSTLILLGTVVTLVLGLQLGGAALPWSDSRVWGNLLGSGLLLFSFIVVQLYKKQRYVLS